MRVKKYIQFINESTHNKSVHVSEDEMNLFSDEAALQELITKNKITLKNGEVLFDENDEETRQLLDQYLEMPGKVEESIFSLGKRPVKESDIYDLFGEFYRAKNNYSDEIQKIINKVATLNKKRPV